MRKTEFRYCELRAEGERRLSGTVVVYGEIGAAPFGRELFEVRAFGDLSEADVILNTMHDRRQLGFEYSRKVRPPRLDF